MIRHRRGDSFTLISQDDHARLAGRLAERVGNDLFAPLQPRESTIRGVALHDCGWPLHDDQPTLNRKGEPLHVLESPMPVATRVWDESARKAAEADAYSGLLVSLHVLHLSALAYQHDPSPHERWERREDLFLLNRFQQQEIERQEILRRQLGMGTNLRLTLGLAPAGTSDEEDRLRFNYMLLKLLDAISLDACCAEPLFPKIEGIHPRPGAAAIEVHLGHPEHGAIEVHPWPFDADRIDLTLPCRQVPVGPYNTEVEFQHLYTAAPIEEYPISLRP